jgi:hypothetical protein
LPSLVFEAYGVSACVRFADEELRAAMVTVVPPGARRIDRAPSAAEFTVRRSAPDGYEVASGDEPVLFDGTFELALHTLDRQIRLHIAANANDWVFVHAGVVAVNGAAIVLPGPSFCGKTTLVAALLELGASYYSDEYAIFDPDGQVHPYPRPLSIRSPEAPRGVDRDPRDVGAVAGDRPAAVRLVAVVLYRPGGSPRWERISPGRAVAAVLANTVPAQARPRQSLRTLGKGLGEATLLEGERGEALPAARLLLRELQSTSAQSP